MEQIERYIDDIEVYELEVNWNEICDTVPALSGKAWEISKDQAFRAFLESLEDCMDCSLLDEEWDGGMPVKTAICLSFSSKFPKNNRSFNQWSNSGAAWRNIG